MSKKILIIDDERDFVETVLFALSSDGFEVSNASNGPNGLEQAKTLLPDLIILDLMMPDMDGYEVARRLKADSQTSAIPILVLTAAVTRDLSQKIRETKAVDYLTKPCDLEELIKRVKLVLGV